MEDSDNWMTIDQLSAHVKIPKSSLYKMAELGDLPCKRIGRRLRFFKPTIDAWMLSGMSEPRPKDTPYFVEPARV